MPPLPHLDRRSGYVSLLAVSFAFGLAVLGTMVAVACRSYLTGASRAERAILERIALETAVWDQLGRLSNGPPLSAREAMFDADGIILEISLPAEKWDPGMDSPEDIKIALGESDALSAFLAAEGGLAERSRAAGLDAGEEDCLRREVTLGRASQERSEVPREPPPLFLAAGDQVDVRAASATGRALWIRARFLGGKEGWRLHDYRLLQLHRESRCSDQR